MTSRYRAKMLELLKPKTFRDATSPVTISSWALGIGTIEYPAGHPRLVLSVCWSITWLVILSSCIKIAIQSDAESTGESTIAQTLYIVFLIFNTFCFVTLVCCGQIRSKDLVPAMEKLEKVVEMLSKLGISKEYESIFKSTIVHLIGIILLQLTTVIHRLSFHNFIPDVGNIIFEQHMSTVVILGDYTFISYIRYIANRFYHLNVRLMELNGEEENPQRLLEDSPSGNRNLCILPTAVGSSHGHSRRGKVSDGLRMVRLLRDAREIHRDLCKVAQAFNNTFGVHIFLSVATSLPLITSLVFAIYRMFRLPDEFTTAITAKIVFLLTSLVVFVMKNVFIVSTCASASTEAQRTGDLFRDFADPNASNERKEQIHAFTLQLMNDPLKFTACGFFALDYAMIRAMVGTVTTYLVLMIQLPRVYSVKSGLTNASTPALGMNTTV